jgi:hypothetical protein
MQGNKCVQSTGADSFLAEKSALRAKKADFADQKGSFTAFLNLGLRQLQQFLLQSHITHL